MITKETYAWIEELLNPEITEISDDDYDRLVKDYFQEDKRDWHEDDSDDDKTWHFEKVNQFWELIRKYIMPEAEKRKLYDFSWYKFPEFERYHLYDELIDDGNFWEDRSKKIFFFDVKFNNCVFLDSSFLADTEFKGKLEFRNVQTNLFFFARSKFNKSVFLDNSIIKKLNISGNIFLGKTFINHNTISNDFRLERNDFNHSIEFIGNKIQNNTFFDQLKFNGTEFVCSETEFFRNIEFSSCNFECNTKFSKTKFNKKVSFNTTKFQKETIFSFCDFNDFTSFHRTIFKDKILFTNTYFENVNFKHLNTNWSHNDGNYKEPPKLSFIDVFFSSSTFFRNINLKKLNLDNCDISAVIFSRCIWNDDENRLKLINELPIKNLETKNRLKLSDENSSKKSEIERLVNKLRDSENHYRQLKKNFDSAKNWELSGKAYVSEMEMRKRRLWLERKYYQWFIFKFYDVFGGYTQDFRKPIVSLFGLILLFSGLYFFIDYDFVKALQRGIKGALPYMQINKETKFEGYWLILRNIELVLGGTFLAFFVLALRKRFKQ